ncbi:MAG: CBS domain-containing protein [Anaerolineaceae bacterium]|jgi:tRNA nucleotidyltransferase (CCA-adding enzyme)
MRIILTHEQADLDAIASLLGAHLLDPESSAVRPYQINRNCNAFLQRYGLDLGCFTSQDLPAKPIAEVFLVDTQSLITIKGLHEKTRVCVLDHHPRKMQGNPNWFYDIQMTGACTTLLVEKIKEQGLPLSSIQATLLLLGIYEDTGSLSYTNTTPRDAHAAAFLLEQGADLNIASHYLNPPLSNVQQQLYDRLMRDISNHEVENQTILIARANALDLNDEISSVAHKMRDFLSPDGLILIVATRQGIRMVFRSTTDNVDMAQMARFFGGGGHRRAASALIRSETRTAAIETSTQWRQTYQTVVNLLPQIVKPAVRVSQIMSQHPLVLSPDQSLEEVAELIQRYSFEGFPVLDKGKVVGLLNRRNVDRALAHKLVSKVGSLMDSGTVYVSPNATINELQDVMAHSGWGQIPVVDPTNEDVVGIVTRTDLIKTHISTSQLPSQAEVVDKMAEIFPPTRFRLLKVIAREAQKYDVPAYLVGGVVRDLLLNRPSQDFDVVIEGDAIGFVKHLEEKIGGRAVAHRRFSTAKWLLIPDKPGITRRIDAGIQLNPDDLPDSVDLISARTEFYERPAALPTVERSSIKMDLHRRDFTINTLALRLDGAHNGRLYDYWGGFDDLNKGLVRVLHTLSFVDDATRMLRAVRFAIRFGFEIEERTLALLKDSLNLLHAVSGARLRHELDLILLESKAITMLDQLEELGILKTIHPSLPWDKQVAKRLRQLTGETGSRQPLRRPEEGRLSASQVRFYCTWLQDLPEKKLTSVAERLRFTNKLYQAILQTGTLTRLLPELAGARPSWITRKLDSFSKETLETVLLQKLSPQIREVLKAYDQSYRRVRALTTGNNLRRLGLPPSRRYQEILDKLKDAWLDGEVTTEQEEQALLQTLIKE